MSESPSTKIQVSHGSLPHWVDPKEPPSKRAPYSTILGQPFTHTVDLILPQELYDIVWSNVAAKMGEARYERVMMSLPDILSKDFLSEHVWKGKTIMLSEGRPGVDKRYSITEGVLRIELPKDVYERTGLLGQPIEDGGRKHQKTRFAIQVDLRQPSMHHGRKAFDRLLWACKNVLAESIAWLFCDPENMNNATRPIAKHKPTTRKLEPIAKRFAGVLLPSLDPCEHTKDDLFDEWALEMQEWLGLVSLQSPQVLQNDQTDPYLSRYQVREGPAGPITQDLINLTWKGYISSTWVRSLLVHINAAVSKAPKRDADFFSLSAYAYDTAVGEQQLGYTILNTPSPVSETRSASGDVTGPQKPLRDYTLWKSSSS